MHVSLQADKGLHVFSQNESASQLYPSHTPMSPQVPILVTSVPLSTVQDRLHSSEQDAVQLHVSGQSCTVLQSYSIARNPSRHWGLKTTSAKHATANPTFIRTIICRDNLIMSCPSFIWAETLKGT